MAWNAHQLAKERLSASLTTFSGEEHQPGAPYFKVTCWRTKVKMEVNSRKNRLKT